MALGSDAAGPGRPADHRAAAAPSTTRAHALVDEQYALLNDVLLPALQRARASSCSRARRWDAQHARWLERLLQREVVPVLSPLGLDPAHPFPRIQNKSLNFIVRLEGKDAFGRDSGLAIVQAPRSLPRLVAAARGAAAASDFVLLSAIVAAVRRRSCSPAWKCSAATSSASRATATCSSTRKKSTTCGARSKASSRTAATAPRCASSRATARPTSTTFLMRQFELSEVDLYEVTGPVNLNRLAAIYDLVHGRT